MLTQTHMGRLKATCVLTQRIKATIHQLTTMLSTSKNNLFPGHNHLLNTGTDDPTLIITLAGTQTIIKVKSHQHQWLPGGYEGDLKMRRWIAWWLAGEWWLFCPV